MLKFSNKPLVFRGSNRAPIKRSFLRDKFLRAIKAARWAPPGRTTMYHRMYKRKPFSGGRAFKYAQRRFVRNSVRKFK